MSHDLQMLTSHDVKAAEVIAAGMASSWDDLACEIRRLFKTAIASTMGDFPDTANAILCAERVLDATVALAEHAELLSEAARHVFPFASINARPRRNAFSTPS